MKNSLVSSVQSIKRYLKHAESCGVNSANLLASAQIDAELLEDNTNRIPTQSLLTFLRSAIIDSRDPCFGLNASRLIQMDTFDILGYIALNCANLKEAMEQVIAYESVNGTNGVTEIIPLEDQVLIRWKSSADDPLIQRHSEENVIASWFRYAQQIVNIDDHPREVWFTHSAPKIENLSIYESTFHCPVRFDQKFSGLLISAEQLDTPFPQANRDMLKLLQQQAEQLLQQQEITNGHTKTTAEVCNLIRLTINNSIPSKNLIAEHLGISSRTLQRQLESEGQSYKQLLQMIRQEMAEYYLKNSTMSIDSISRKVGFVDARSFQRSFKQWTGNTPGNFRASNTHSDELSGHNCEP
jgi:AraC-like DNA-binding protein